MYTECSLNFHWTFPGGWLNVHWNVGRARSLRRPKSVYLDYLGVWGVEHLQTSSPTLPSSGALPCRFTNWMPNKIKTTHASAYFLYQGWFAVWRLSTPFHKTRLPNVLHIIFNRSQSGRYTSRGLLSPLYFIDCLSTKGSKWFKEQGDLLLGTT